MESLLGAPTRLFKPQTVKIICEKIHGNIRPIFWTTWMKDAGCLPNMSFWTQEQTYSILFLAGYRKKFPFAPLPPEFFDYATLEKIGREIIDRSIDQAGVEGHKVQEYLKDKYGITMPLPRIRHKMFVITGQKFILGGVYPYNVIDRLSKLQ